MERQTARGLQTASPAAPRTPAIHTHTHIIATTKKRPCRDPRTPPPTAGSTAAQCVPLHRNRRSYSPRSLLGVLPVDS
eukprot:147131-Prymnesium_polylepis.1